MEGLELDISPSNLIFSLAITSFSICLIPASSLKRSATHHQWLCYQFFFAQSHISLSSSWYPSLKSIPKCFLCLISCCWNSTIPVHIIVITIFSFLFLSLCVLFLVESTLKQPLASIFQVFFSSNHLVNSLNSSTQTQPSDSSKNSLKISSSSVS